MEEIEKLEEQCDPLNLKAFKDLAKKAGLNGVHKPYWRDWDFADPSDFVTIDILHGLTKFAGDHLIKWMKKLIGKDEIDRRFSALQHIIGRRHFGEGITRIKQHTREEEGDILRNLVVISKGARRVDSEIMKALRAFVDFAYVAQYEYHNEVTIAYMEKYLKDFHTYKRAFVAAGLRKKMHDDFRIPKLEVFLHYARKIRRAGSLGQYSTETTERLHIPMAKQPYGHTNRKNYEVQMCDFLDRCEGVHLFDIQLQWRKLLDGVTEQLQDGVDTDEEVDLVNAQKELDEAMLELAAKVLPKPRVNLFAIKKPLMTDTMAFRVTNRAHWKKVSLQTVIATYKLPDFLTTFINYFNSTSSFHWREVTEIPITSVDIWNNVRLQLKTVQDENVLTVPQTVMASPPSEGLPFGFCNFVLFAESEPPYVGISS